MIIISHRGARGILQIKISFLSRSSSEIQLIVYLTFWITEGIDVFEIVYFLENVVRVKIAFCGTQR